MKIFILIIYLLTTTYILSTQLSLLLQISFWLNLTIFSYLFKRILRKAVFNPFFIVTYIFFYLFFILAPVIQLSVNPGVLVNELPFTESSGLYANAIIAVFYISLYFTTNRFVPTKLSLAEKTFHAHNDKKGVLASALALTIFGIIITAICTPSVIIAMRGTGELVATSIVGEDKSGGLILTKFIMMLPFAILLKIFTYKEKIPSLLFNLLMPINLLCVAILKNPLTEKRNTIGAIYLTVLFFLFEKKVKDNFVFFISIFVLFVLVFPLSSFLTHTSGDIGDRIEFFTTSIGSDSILDIIYSHFLQIHYDAWAVVIATVEYVKYVGLSYGYLLLGVLLFFIPRTLWVTKPYGSGQTIVDEYLYTRASAWNNISCPLPAEGYVNFGIFGVVLFAIALGLYFRHAIIHVNAFKNDKRFIYMFFAFYLFYLLRGDLLSCVAYYVAFLACCYVVDKVAGVSKNIWKH